MLVKGDIRGWEKQRLSREGPQKKEPDGLGKRRAVCSGEKVKHFRIKKQASWGNNNKGCLGDVQYPRVISLASYCHSLPKPSHRGTLGTKPCGCIRTRETMISRGREGEKNEQM